MDFCIADTFTASLARLTAQDQKAAKTTAFDLQMDPSAPAGDGSKFSPQFLFGEWADVVDDWQLTT